jgi:hypothetical protein
MPLKKYLFYPATPDGSISCKHATLNCSKKAMAYVNTFCSSNMSGTNKRKLFFIEKGAKPQCFKGINMKCLPVLYYANKRHG